MNTYICLLRGINVSGKNKIKMQDLRKMLEDCRFAEINTYIQSGNIVFQSNETDTQKLEETIHQAIEKTFGYDVLVMVRTKNYIVATYQNNPFLKRGETDIKFMHVSFLDKAPEAELVQKIKEIDTGNEEFVVAGDKLYLFYPDGYGRAKMTNTFFEKKLKVTSTTRNWKTCTKLFEMVQ